MNKVILVSLSGGLDSTTLLADILKQPKKWMGEVRTVGFGYGSKHNALENKAAHKVANHYKVPFQLVDFSSVILGKFKSNLLRDGGEIPEGHYEDKTMEMTVVPGRNILFISYLAGLCWSLGGGSVAIGVHAGDHSIYPDCRPDFIQAMDQAVIHGTDKKVSVLAPYLFLTKAEIVQRGHDLGAPFHLTRTCYTDDEVACGRCGSCQERLSSFAHWDLSDPLLYEQREILPKNGVNNG